MIQLRRAALAALLTTMVCSCDSASYLLLLEIYASSPVAEVQLTLGAYDDAGRETYRHPTLFLPAAQRDLSTEPLRVSIDVGGPAAVLLRVEGRDADGQLLVASRCYDLATSSLIRDEMVLVGPLGSLDADGDGFLTTPSETCQERSSNGDFRSCTPEDEYLCVDSLILDCEPDNPNIYPGAPVVCEDGVDDDCDGSDEDCGDGDGDGFDACPEEPVPGCDCDDANPAVNPGVTGEILSGASRTCENGIDEDCDGVDAFCDLDEDQFTSDEDCDDENDTVYPQADETCDGLDNNCNGLVDEVPECAPADGDGDGSDACEGDPDGTCDCNDCDAGIAGGGVREEACWRYEGDTIVGGGNGADEDCDGMVDEGCDATADADGDGDPPPRDCNDMDFWTRPTIETVPERCGDGIAQDCMAGQEAARCAEGMDVDGDGWAEPGACEGNAEINPDQTERCNGIDDDCDGEIDELVSVDPDLDGCRRQVDDMGGFTAVRLDFATDFANCGGCRVFCDPTTANACTGGVCDCTNEGGDPAACSSGDNPTCCDDGCRDIDNDPQNCGGCGLECGEGETCEAGVCRCGTAAGSRDGAIPDACSDSNQICCAGSCSDVRSDDSNCGSCGFVCGPNSSCNMGFCQCDGGTATFIPDDCNGDLSSPSNDGCETNLVNDVNACGSCTNGCSGSNAMWSCESSVCRITGCSGTFEDCDTQDSTGCEIDTSSSPSNCGGCRMNCNLPRTDRHTCTGGVCEVSVCEANYGNCDGSDGNGCEVNLLSNDENCGTCGNDCGTNGNCAGGGCECVGSNLNCTGGNDCETPFSETDCGGCGVSCGAGEVCQTNGACACAGNAGTVGAGERCAGPGNECCSGGCVDVRSSTTHCGTCDNTCGTNETCAAGDCDCQGTRQASGEACTGATPDCCGGGVGCVDLDTNLSHCGSCGAACDLDKANRCDGRTCRCGTNSACGAANTCCGTGSGASCVNTDNDDQNCGACGNTCGTGQTCSGGMCVCDGGGGFRACMPSGQCEVPANDSCGTNCSDCTATSGAQCCGDFASGSCVITGGEDEGNCGGCGISCSGTCNAGSCCSGVTQCATSTGPGGMCVNGESTDTACGSGGELCVDCAAMGRVCVDGSCAVCEANTTNGCTGGDVCNSEGTVCVECNDDGDCGGDQCVANQCEVCDPSDNAGCSADAPECVFESGAPVCRFCNAATNAGCSVGEECLGDGAACVECILDGDCDAGRLCVDNFCQVCDPADDRGCGDLACTDAGDACVACTADADCGASAICMSDNTCCSGCTSGGRTGSCEPGTAKMFCGAGGMECVNCSASSTCEAGSCT